MSCWTDWPISKIWMCFSVQGLHMHSCTMTLTACLNQRTTRGGKRGRCRGSRWANLTRTWTLHSPMGLFRRYASLLKVWKAPQDITRFLATLLLVERSLRTLLDCSQPMFYMIRSFLADSPAAVASTRLIS